MKHHVVFCGFKRALLRVRAGFGKFSKVMKIENAIFQDMESFGKEMIFYNSSGKVLEFCLEKF